MRSKNSAGREVLWELEFEVNAAVKSQPIAASGWPVVRSTGQNLAAFKVLGHTEFVDLVHHTNEVTSP